MKEDVRPTPARGPRGRAPLRVAIIAPPWIPVPPPGYGGVEAVVAQLCAALVGRGHHVSLFAPPGSRSPAEVHEILDAAHPDLIGSALHEADHVAGAFDAVDRAAASGVPFDVVHDHSGFTAVAMATRLRTPMVHTLHGPLSGAAASFHRRHARSALLVAISSAQARSAPPDIGIAAVVPNPIDLDGWPFSAEKDDYLLWIGRMSAVKGAHRAIAAARIAGRRLVLAGPIQASEPEQRAYFAECVAPLVDGERVRYVGEVAGAAKRRLFARASALLMPIRWPEPFGMVMAEALAAGTPVIAFPEGAAAEVVIDGRNGLLVDDEVDMADAIARVSGIDPRDCRESVRTRYSAAITAAGYEDVYSMALDRAGPGRSEREGALTAVHGHHG